MFATMLRCVSIAPLATPVVPPVYCRKATSSGPTSTGVERQRRSLRQHVVEAHGAGQDPGRNHFLHVPHDEVGERPLGEAEQVADRR